MARHLARLLQSTTPRERDGLAELRPPGLPAGIGSRRTGIALDGEGDR